MTPCLMEISQPLVGMVVPSPMFQKKRIPSRHLSCQFLLSLRSRGMLSLPPVLRGLSSPVRRCLASGTASDFFDGCRVSVFPRAGQSSWLLCLLVTRQGNLSLCIRGVCNHEIPLVSGCSRLAPSCSNGAQESLLRRWNCAPHRSQLKVRFQWLLGFAEHYFTNLVPRRSCCTCSVHWTSNLNVARFLWSLLS